MGRISKDAARLHREAVALVDSGRPLTETEKEFVLDHFHEAADTAHNLAGAFFTPEALAQDFATFHIDGTRIIDLCAGIGRLAFHALNRYDHQYNGEPLRQIVCVEKNPDYVRVGRAVLPEATWICADVLDVPDMLDELGGLFDCAISNPPFGRIARDRDSPIYTGPEFEFHVVAVAAKVARSGAFILPQESTPYRYSSYVPRQSVHAKSAKYLRFEQQTGIDLQFGVGINTCGDTYAWRGVKPVTEIVISHFDHPEPEEQPVPDTTAATPTAWGLVQEIVAATNLPKPGKRKKRLKQIRREHAAQLHLTDGTGEHTVGSVLDKALAQAKADHRKEKQTAA
ncbi:class I SAM-dependent methyltransferase [Streptomyces hydrogenans]|uniref:methyltransferase n=1 Tax=Streptomyces hydrogenans TaxID=1873719 RepID=UPI0038256773